MLSIFWFSHQDGRETMKQSRYVKKQIEKVLGKRLSVNIRKNAHFFIYLGLGSGLLLCREKRGTKEILKRYFKQHCLFYYMLLVMSIIRVLYQEERLL